MRNRLFFDSHLNDLAVKPGILILHETFSENEITRPYMVGYLNDRIRGMLRNAHQLLLATFLTGLILVSKQLQNSHQR